METRITLSLKCPHCGKSFTDNSHQVNGQPGIKVDVKTIRDTGTLWLCPIYGCFSHESSIEIKDKETVEAFCPHCSHALNRESICEVCNAHMIGFNIDAGGKVNICSRKGCHNHYLVFEDVNVVLRLFQEKFEKL
jgi:DNA-directed RNA polymerase subunit RPC12/RpoP